MREMENKYGTIQVVDKYGTLKEYTARGDKYATLRDAGKYATVRGGVGMASRETPVQRALTKISSLQLQPAQAAAIAAAVSASRQSHAHLSVHGPPQPNGPGPAAAGHPGDCSPSEGDSSLAMAPGTSPVPVQEPERGLSRTNSMQQLEHWVRTQKTRGLDEDTRSVTSYQTLPRNMPSHRALMVPRYPEGYRTLPRNSLARPDSICSAADSLYDQALRPASTSTGIMVERRRSMRDDTMWQLYEWQQRQAFSRQSLALPTAGGHYGTLPSAKTMGNISEHVAHSIPPSPSRLPGSLQHPPPPSPAGPPQPSSSHSEVSSPVFRRRPLTPGTGPSLQSRGRPSPSITPQSLQGKTPEELTLLLIKLRRQQAELSSLREHTVSQLMALGMEGPNAKTDVLSHHLQRNLIYLDSQTKENEPLIFMIHTMIENSAPRPQLYQQVSPDDHKEGSFIQRTEEPDIDLCRLCEQDKAVRLQEDKLQQLHREKHTLETALLSASQELSEHSGNNGAAQSLLQQRDTLQRDTLQSGLLQQRDTLQSGLLSTCRELSRVTTTEPPSQRHIQIQKELWRIQDVMEALAKTNPSGAQITVRLHIHFTFISSGVPASRPLSSLQKNEIRCCHSVLSKRRTACPPARPCPSTTTQQSAPPTCPPTTHTQGRLQPQTHRPEDRKAGSRNGVHSQNPDYRLYKSEPELTTVKEELDEANGEDKDKAESSDTASKAPSCPVGIIPPRTKSPVSPLESSTIASYVTLRKTKKPESRSERPRSAVDQTSFGEREGGRTRMSVEEQLERMRRNQEASSLREKKRDPVPLALLQQRQPCYYPAGDKLASVLTFSLPNIFSRSNNPSVCVPVCVQGRGQMEGACADPVQLEAALQQLKVETMEQSRTHPAPEEVQGVEECEEVQQDGPLQREEELQDELCVSQRVVIVDLCAEPQRVEIVNPFEDDESREQDLTSSPTNTTTENSFQTPEPETPSPEPREEEAEEKQQREEELKERRTADHKKHNNNNNNMLA
ncbi:hypothetical protein F7725_021489, partial [Dissostichus mawsoni]